MRLAAALRITTAPPSRRWRPPARVQAAALLLLALQVEVACAEDEAGDPRESTRLRVHRRVAAMAGGGEGGPRVCGAQGSFLGVGNTECLNDNLGAAIFLLLVIVLVSTGFERAIHHTRRAIVCPQLRRIVGRIFQEIMILGFLSMVIFTLNTSGLLEAVSFTFDESLTTTERLHFYEFFHYVVFLTMIYFIAIVLLLLFIGTVAPKLLWESANARSVGRTNAGRLYRLESDSEDRLDYYHHDEDDLDEDQDTKGSGRSKQQALNQAGNALATPPASTLSDDEDGTDNTVADRRNDVQVGNQFTWCRQDERNGMMQSFATMRDRSKSGMNLALGARAYALLLHRYQHEGGWCFRLNLRKQWQLYKSFELLAYNICQHRSGYIYKNAREMERLFDVRPPPPPCPIDMNADDYMASCDPVPASAAPAFTFEQYHVLCMRNLLFHMTELHPSAFLVLVAISVLPSAFPSSAHWIFVGVGAALLLVNVVILFKVYHILRGIVDDRLRVISMREIQARLDHTAATRGSGSNPPVRPRKLTFKAAALAVRAILRMQMSALCHSALHHHDHRFWFSSPKFLLRMFQFATIGQAFYLVWLSLVETQAVLQETSTVAVWYYMLVMLALPALALFVITPMTMPSLVLVLSLTGIFAELNAESETNAHHKVDKRTAREEAKIHMRIMRRSFLRSHYSDDEDRYIARHTFTQDNVLNVEDSGMDSDRGSRRSRVSTPAPRPPVPESADGAADSAEVIMSPTATPNNVFLRIYDSPVIAVQHSKLSAPELMSPSSQRSSGDGSAILGRWRRDRGSGKYRSRPRGAWALDRSRSSSYSNDSIGSSHSYHRFDNSHSLGRSGTLPSGRNAPRGGSWGPLSSSRNTRSFGSFGRDQSGYSGTSRHFDLAAFQATGGNPRAALSSVYHSPRQTRGRGEWSQAPMSNDSTPPTSTSQQPQSQPQSLSLPWVGSNSAGLDDGSASNPPIGDDAVLSPVATTFKSYCSKYGGYPEQ